MIIASVTQYKRAEKIPASIMPAGIFLIDETSMGMKKSFHVTTCLHTLSI